MCFVRTGIGLIDCSVYMFQLSLQVPRCHICDTSFSSQFSCVGLFGVHWTFLLRHLSYY